MNFQSETPTIGLIAIGCLVYLFLPSTFAAESTNFQSRSPASYNSVVVTAARQNSHYLSEFERTYEMAMSGDTKAKLDLGGMVVDCSYAWAYSNVQEMIKVWEQSESTHPVDYAFYKENFAACRYVLAHLPAGASPASWRASLSREAVAAGDSVAEIIIAVEQDPIEALARLDDHPEILNEHHLARFALLELLLSQGLVDPGENGETESMWVLGAFVCSADPSCPLEQRFDALARTQSQVVVDKIIAGYAHLEAKIAAGAPLGLRQLKSHQDLAQLWR